MMSFDSSSSSVTSSSTISAVISSSVSSISSPMLGMAGLHTSLVKLDGTNYPTWSMAFSTFIFANRQSKWIGEEPPFDATILDEWRVTDAALCTLLWGSMKESVRHLFLTCTTAREVWIKCALLYSGKNNINRACDTWEALFEAKINDAGLPSIMLVSSLCISDRILIFLMLLQLLRCINEKLIRWWFSFLWPWFIS